MNKKKEQQIFINMHNTQHILISNQGKK